MDTEGRSDAFRKGLAVRSEVLGEEYVERAFREANAFDSDLQDFLTEHAWGAVWAREGLPRRVRSMLVLAMTAVLGRPHELELHLRGALTNGVTPDEIKEVLLQTAVYGGAPACLDAFRVARKVLREAGRI